MKKKPKNVAKKQSHSAKAPRDKKKPAKKAKKILAKKKRTVARPVAQQQMGAFPAESFFKAKIKVIGIGGGGGSIVSEIGRSLHKATFVIADTDVRAFRKKAGIKYFLFGQELTHGLGTGLHTELARKAAESEKDKIAKLFSGQDIVIFIASLGGGLGSGATQIFAEAAKDFGGITFGIFTLPFKFEGKQKYAIATKALRELRKSLNVSITIPNERIFKIIQENTAITDAFSTVNRNLIESLESLIDLIYSPGVINIDFADLKAILKGVGNLAFLNTAEASGADRADKIIHDILHNPLYQSNNFKVEKVLFNIAGGGNLSMFEVDKISRAISEQNPSAKIIFGISKELALKNKIKTTLLMTGLPLGSEAPVILPEIKKIVKKVIPVKKTKPVKQKKPKPPKKNVVAKPKKEKVVRENVLPAFNPAPVNSESFAKLSVMDVVEKRAIRRTALEVKQAEELEEQKKTKQEEEWEIPAFLRFKK